LAAIILKRKKKGSKKEVSSDGEGWVVAIRKGINKELRVTESKPVQLGSWCNRGKNHRGKVGVGGLSISTAILEEVQEMNHQCPNYRFFPSRANPPFLLQLGNQQVSSRKSQRKMGLAVVKVLLLIGSMVLAVNLWLASSCRNLEQAVCKVEKIRQERIDSQLSLRAKRDHLYAPDRIRMIAAEQLSLYVPDKEGR
jgi:hypothetical protein